MDKTLVRDLLVSGDFTPSGGPVREHLDGMALLEDGNLLIVSDDRGVDRTNGETLLLRIGTPF